MGRLLSYLVYRVACVLAGLICPRPELLGLENLPEGPCVIVGNHAQMNGPIIADLYLPGRRVIWCAAEMMTLKDVPDYAYRDFWSRKPASVRWLFRIASYLIAPISVCVFNNAHCVPVYRDLRVATTFRETLARLKLGERVIIFPEMDEPLNHIVYRFQDRFLDLGRMYHSQTGETLSFVPMYVCPALHKVCFGAPLRYDAQARPAEERVRLCRALEDAVTALADGLPPHRVVPYRNIPKRDYPHNHPTEGDRT